jgi:hypothetical protein
MSIAGNSNNFLVKEQVVIMRGLFVNKSTLSRRFCLRNLRLNGDAPFSVLFLIPLILAVASCNDSKSPATTGLRAGETEAQTAADIETHTGAKFTMVAVIAGAGKDAPPDLIPATILDDLQNAASIKLVERSRLNQVLAELRLSNAGLTESATATRLGRLVSADVLVTINRLPPPVAQLGASRDMGFPHMPLDGARIRVIDTRTGVILDNWVLPTLEANNPKKAASRVTTAIGRRGAIAERIQYVGPTFASNLNFTGFWETFPRFSCVVAG